METKDKVRRLCGRQLRTVKLFCLLCDPVLPFLYTLQKFVSLDLGMDRGRTNSVLRVWDRILGASMANTSPGWSRNMEQEYGSSCEFRNLS